MFYTWLLPVVWAVVAFASAYYPGDEYGLLATGSVMGIWVLFLVKNSSGIWASLPLLLLAGGASMAVVGLLLDLLRTPRRLWIVLWLVLASLICLVYIESYPSYQRAMCKNGSLQAYIFFSLNAGLTVTCLILLLIMPVWRITHRKPPAGYCQNCNYDLTGNKSGTCPECGEKIQPTAKPGE